MKRILLGLTQPQHDRLRRRAADRHVSVAKLVREAVEQVYPDELEARRLAHLRSLSALGVFHSGQTDISERHDDYLAEAYMADIERNRPSLTDPERS